MTQKEKIDWRVVSIGIGCLTAIEIVALSKGVDGALMTLVIGVIGCAIGVAIPFNIKKK